MYYNRGEEGLVCLTVDTLEVFQSLVCGEVVRASRSVKPNDYSSPGWQSILQSFNSALLCALSFQSDPNTHPIKGLYPRFEVNDHGISLNHAFRSIDSITRLAG